MDIQSVYGINYRDLFLRDETTLPPSASVGTLPTGLSPVRPAGALSICRVAVIAAATEAKDKLMDGAK